MSDSVPCGQGAGHGADFVAGVLQSASSRCVTDQPGGERLLTLVQEKRCLPFSVVEVSPIVIVQMDTSGDKSVGTKAGRDEKPVVTLCSVSLRGLRRHVRIVPMRHLGTK